MPLTASRPPRPRPAWDRMHGAPDRPPRPAPGAQPDPSRPTLVVGVDFTPTNEAALEQAIATARRMDARLALVHALTPLGAPGLDLSHPQFQPERNESADVVGTEASPADEWAERAWSQGVPVEVVSRAGHPSTVIAEEARRRHAAAIIVGTHEGGFEARPPGTVARGVARKATQPVLLVPGGEGGRQTIVAPP